MKSRKEKLYIILYTLFGKNLPVSYRLKLAKKIRYFFGEKILGGIGVDVNIEKGANFNSNCFIDDYSGIGVNCELNANPGGAIKIGKRVLMGPEVIIYTRNHSTKRIDISIQEQGYDDPKQVIIEDDVWICRRVIILPGVKIGKGSVLGAGAVISKDIPPYSVAVGNPAKIIKDRRNNL